MQFIVKKTDNTIETHIKKLFSSYEMKKCPDNYRDDNQILNTFSEEIKEDAQQIAFFTKGLKKICVSLPNLREKLHTDLAELRRG